MSTLHVNCGCNLGILRCFCCNLCEKYRLFSVIKDMISRYLQLIFSFIGYGKYRVFTEIIHVKL